jgi:hypothetical protein
MQHKEIPPPPVARRFIWYVTSFMVTVAVGLAPFLGKVRVRGFDALLDLFPLQLQHGLIPVSAFFMGVVVVAVQFYSSGKLSLALLDRRFKLGLYSTVAALLILFIVYLTFVVLVPIDGDRSIAVLVGWSPQGACCKDVKDNAIECVKQTSLDPSAIRNCWGNGQITTVTVLMSLPYLACTGGVGVLVGIIIVKEQILWRNRRKQLKKKAAQTVPEPQK